MRTFFFGLLFIAICAGCTPDTAAPTSVPAAAGSLTAFLALGDSYSIGESVPPADRWPVQLARLAQAQQVPLALPDLTARTGWTTDELQDAIQASGNHKIYGLVSLLIGVNNQYRGESLATYRQDFQGLLQTAVRLAGGRAGRVVVLSIPDWGQSPFAQGRNRAQIGREIDQFNAVAQQECARTGIAYVDITALSRGAADDATQFADDGLHYSGRQMAQWAQQALPVVKALLKNP
jgi:lysophospholipase L1-like esterase